MRPWYGCDRFTLNWFTVEPLHACLFDICHLRGVGQHTLNTFCCCWSLCANDSRLSWRSAWHFNRVYPHHLPLEHLVEHELVGVYLCGRCKVVAPLPQIAKLSKNSQHSMWFQVWWANLSRYMESIKKIMSFGGDLSGGSIKKPNPKFGSKMLPFKTTINILVIIPYTKKLQYFKFEVWVVTSKLQNNCSVGFGKKTLDLQLRSLKMRPHFLNKVEENLAWEVMVKVTRPSTNTFSSSPTSHRIWTKQFMRAN